MPRPPKKRRHTDAGVGSEGGRLLLWVAVANCLKGRGVMNVGFFTGKNKGKRGLDRLERKKDYDV